jgi:hypothetical protein
MKTIGVSVSEGLGIADLIYVGVGGTRERERGVLYFTIR